MCVGGGVKVGVCFIRHSRPGERPHFSVAQMLPTFARFAYSKRIRQSGLEDVCLHLIFVCKPSLVLGAVVYSWCLFAIIPFHTVWRGCPFPLLSLVAPALCDPPLWRRRRAAGCATPLTRHDAARDSGGWGDQPEDCTPRHTTHACGGGSCMGQLSSLCWCLLPGPCSVPQHRLMFAYVSFRACQSTLLKLCQPLAGAELNAARLLTDMAWASHVHDSAVYVKCRCSVLWRLVQASGQFCVVGACSGSQDAPQGLSCCHRAVSLLQGCCGTVVRQQ